MTGAEAQGQGPEWSIPLRLADLAPGETTTLVVTADEMVRSDLAARYGIIGVEAASARLQVVQSRNGRVAISGALEARVVQSCIVTLDPVTSQISGPVDVLVLPPGDVGPSDPDAEIDGPDIDSHDGVTVDLGEILSQTLAVLLPDYPRAPGAAVPEPTTEPDEDEARENPFAVLARLKENGGG